MCRQYCTLNLTPYVPHTDLQKLRTSIAYDRWSHVWDLARYINYSIYRTALASLAAPHQRIVDVGCGTGLMSLKLAATGRQVLGVDLSSAMIEHARSRSSARLEFLQADAENLPLESASFDAVVNLISFHHYPNPDRALAEFRRVFRPGGRLVLIAFDLDSYFIQLAQKVNRWTKNIAGDAWQKTCRRGSHPRPLFRFCFGQTQTRALLVQDFSRRRRHRP
jgi:ubiquinone/menaquinone biosynthesis C-methylase UbiE